MSAMEFDFASVLGVCGLVGYEAEVNQCIGLNKDARSDFNLLLTVSKVDADVKHRIQYAVLTANTEWFDTLFAVCNRRDIANLRTYYKETLIHLLCGYCYPLGSREPPCGCCYYYDYYDEYKPSHVSNEGDITHIFSQLITCGIDLNVQITNGLFYSKLGSGCTALMLTIQDNNYVLFNELMKYAAQLDFNVCTSPSSMQGLNALQLACKVGNAAIVQQLCLIEEIDLNVVDEMGNNPFMIAAELGYVGSINELLKYCHRFEKNKRNNYGYTAFYCAVKSHHLDIVRILCNTEGIDINLGNTSNRFNPFMVAAENGYTEIVEELLKHRDRFDINYGPYATAFSLAVGFGHSDVVKLLCNTEGIDIDTIEKETGNTPLIFAANTDQPEIMEELLRHHNRFDINHRNNNMESVMLIVCRYHRLEMVRLLCVIPGIELDCKDKDGNNYYY